MFYQLNKYTLLLTMWKNEIKRLGVSNLWANTINGRSINDMFHKRAYNPRACSICYNYDELLFFLHIISFSFFLLHFFSVVPVTKTKNCPICWGGGRTLADTTMLFNHFLSETAICRNVGFESFSYVPRGNKKVTQISLVSEGGWGGCWRAQNECDEGVMRVGKGSIN